MPSELGCRKRMVAIFLLPTETRCSKIFEIYDQNATLQDKLPNGMEANLANEVGLSKEGGAMGALLITILSVWRR